MLTAQRSGQMPQSRIHGQKKNARNILKKIDQHIETVLDECETLDNQEQNQPSLIKLNKEITDKQALKTKVETILKELKQDDKKSINTIDKECTRINSVQGSGAGYNAQTVVDEKHGLIVNTDVVSQNNDVNQFANQIEQANETLGKKCNTACADSGYANTEQLKQIDLQNIKVIVPSQRQASKKEPEEFDKERFNYNSEKDCYICPQGHNLTYEGSDGKTKRYKITENSICQQCSYFGKCTKSPDGRQINRLVDEEIRLMLEAQYLQPESQAIYKLRKQKVELPFGHIKRNLGVKDFLLRGIDGVKAEMSVLATCFNMARMITIFGVTGLIKELILIR